MISAFRMGPVNGIIQAVKDPAWNNSCTFTQHAECVAPIVHAAPWDSSECIEPCIDRNYEVKGTFKTTQIDFFKEKLQNKFSRTL